MRMLKKRGQSERGSLEKEKKKTGYESWASCTSRRKTFVAKSMEKEMGNWMRTAPIPNLGG